MTTLAVAVEKELVMAMAPILGSVWSWLTMMVAPFFSILCSSSGNWS